MPQFCVIGNMEKVTVSVTVVEKSAGSGILVVLIVQSYSLLLTILKTPKLSWITWPEKTKPDLTHLATKSDQNLYYLSVSTDIFHQKKYSFGWLCSAAFNPSGDGTSLVNTTFWNKNIWIPNPIWPQVFTWNIMVL